MTMDHGVILGLLGVPLAAAAVVAALGPRRLDTIRWLSLAASLATLGLALVLTCRFLAHERAQPLRPYGAKGQSMPTFRPVFVPGSPSLDGSEEASHRTRWNLLQIGPGTVQFYLGVDGLNVWLVVLTAVLMLPSVLISWNHVTERVNEFYAWLLALQTTMMGIFLAFDIILFYVFFELSLVPLFFLIGIWGGPERRHAARKFFIYTLAGSLLSLLGILGIVLACFEKTGQLTFSIPLLVEHVHVQLDNSAGSLGSPEDRAYWNAVQFYCFFALMAGFAVKVPLVPLHTWLPLAHVEAPTAGSVDLAGVLLKVGAYGFLRLCVPLAPDSSLAYGLPLVTTLAAVGVIYGAFCAYSQDDIKKLIAYSSVSHLGLCMLGMYSLTVVGLTGSILQMVNHGLSTAALFLLIGMIYDRYHTRKLSDYGGMAARMPLFGAFLVFTCLASVGMPGLNGFVGEVLCLFGMFERSPALAVAGATGIVLGAWYLFTMLQKLLFGPLKEPSRHSHDHGDLNGRELAIVVPIAALCLVLGLYPQPLLNTVAPDVQTVAFIADQARARAERRPALDELEEDVPISMAP
jgi:NADH-quinone oxidoreductase subunit M